MPLSQHNKLFTFARPNQHNFLILWPMNVIQINFIIYDQFAFVQFNFPQDKWNPSFSSWLQMKLITLSPLWEAAPHDKVSRSVDGRTTSYIVRFFNYFPQTAIKPLYKYKTPSSRSVRHRDHFFEPKCCNICIQGLCGIIEQSPIKCSF